MIYKQAYFDLDLNEIALIVHGFLKKLMRNYCTVNFHIDEATHYDKFTLIVIASDMSITQKQLIKIFDEIVKNSILERKGE